MSSVEEWRSVVGYEGLYEVSSLGQVKALERLVMNNGGLQHKHERILKPHYDRGYAMVVLCKEGKTKPSLVHRVVAEAFIPNPENKPNIDHIDTNPSNNNVDNLRWVTQKENANNPLSRINNSKSKIGHPNYRTEPHSVEAREKISKALKGRKLSVEHLEKLKQARLGTTLSEETKRKISEARKGHPVSEYARQRIGEAHKGLFKGKHWKKEGDKRVWYC